jgi:hypothetical protein
MRRNQAGMVTAMTVALLWGGVAWSGCGGDDDDQPVDRAVEAEQDAGKAGPGDGAPKDEGAQVGGAAEPEGADGGEEGTQPDTVIIDPKGGKPVEVDVQDIREAIGGERLEKLKQKAEAFGADIPGTEPKEKEEEKEED